MAGMTTRLAVAGAMLVLAAGCAPNAAAPGTGAGGAGLELNVQPQPARIGQEVELTLVNRSARQVGYNLCPSVLQRQVGGQWQPATIAFTEVCTMELRILEPGASASFRHPLPTGLQPGTYRFWAGVEWPMGEDRVGVQSGPFEVVQ